MSEETVEFKSALHGISVCLTANALRAIKEQALAAGDLETGGILIGSYDTAGLRSTVTEATSKSGDSRAGRAWFQRGVRGLKDLLRQRWHDGQYYVGEWHSHPGGTPEPSGNDIREMKAISEEASYICQRPIMIIAGTRDQTDVGLSASVMGGNALIRLARVTELPQMPALLKAAMENDG